MHLVKAEIISIGTELLIGSILNTNSQYLSRVLADEAVDVFRQTTVGDNIDRLVDTLKTAAWRSDLLILSGGLGPTEDDITVEALCRFLNRPVVFHQPTAKHIALRLKKRRVKFTPRIRRQCDIPQGARVFNNDCGTAPGTLNEFYFGGQRKWLMALPGPPKELEPMFPVMMRVLRRLAGLPQASFVIRTLRVCGLIEASVADRVSDLLRLHPPLTLGIYAKNQEVELKIMTKEDSRGLAKQRVLAMEQEIRRRLGPHVFGVDEETLSSVVGQALRKRGLTLSTAESCTGGLLSAKLTEMPGSSDFYIGGLICYHNRIKSEELGISNLLLRKFGAVSVPVARAMAQRIRKKYSTDLGISITGIAGPAGGTNSKPVGLVFIALADSHGCRAEKYFFMGARSQVRDAAVARALNLVRLKLLRAP